MAEITLCPHYLVDYPYENSDDVEDNIVSCLLALIEIIEHEKGINLVISKEIFELCENGYPWNLYEDPDWSQILNIWCTAIWPYLGKATIISSEPNNVSTNLKNCTSISDRVFHIFESFLDNFGKLGIAKQKNEEAIFTHTTCCYPDEYRGFLIVNQEFNNLKILKNSWLRIYPVNSLLPVSGDFKFIPPDTWRNSLSPLKNNKEPYGFIDNNGRVWGWDKLHKDHWDVQKSINSGKDEYDNVSPQGALL